MAPLQSNSKISKQINKLPIYPFSAPGGCFYPANSYPMCSKLWQATKWPEETSLNSGMDAAQASVAWGQRVRKGQPEGAFRGLGISPDRTIRWLARATLGSGTGTADIRHLV